MRNATGWLTGAALALWAGVAAAQTPVPVEGDYRTREFALESGAVLPELTIHYRTLGTPVRDAAGRITNAVMILHGTGGTGAQFLVPQFADELYGPGQPLDVSRYYVILPDNLGHGGSSKPSDGLRAAFPEYDYADMVEAQRRLLVEGLGVDHLRLIFGTSMGCMHIFVWAETHPDFAEALAGRRLCRTAAAGAAHGRRPAAAGGFGPDADAARPGHARDRRRLAGRAAGPAHPGAGRQ